jgi:hypothetical protein
VAAAGQPQQRRRRQQQGQQQQAACDIAKGRPYGEPGRKYAQGTRILLPGTQQRSGACIPTASMLKQCHLAGSGQHNSMLTAFEDVDVLPVFKNLVRPGAPGVAPAIPDNSRPGTLFLHLAQGNEFLGNRGSCGKCKKGTSSGQ